MIGIKFRNLVLATFIAAAAFGTAALPANATSFPLHAPGTVSCDSATATVTAYAPAGNAAVYGTNGGSMYSFYPSPSRERVYWTSALQRYRFDLGRWVDQDTTSDPWHYAFANDRGLQAWQFAGSYTWSSSPNDGIAFQQFSYRNLPRDAYYRVWNFFSWDSLAEDPPPLTAVKYNGGAADYCYVG